MAKRLLKAKEIEKLENTSFAAALGQGGLIQGGEQTGSWICSGGCCEDTCADSCGCPSGTCPSATCPSAACTDPGGVSELTTNCCDALIRQLRNIAEGGVPMITAVEAR